MCSMKGLRLYIILGICVFSLGINAEPVEHENILKVKYGWVRQADPYLSPLTYKGQEIGIGNEWWQTFQRDSVAGIKEHVQGWEHVGRVDVHGLRAFSSAGSNYIYGFGFHGGWGAYYKWSFANERLRVHVGPYLEGDFMVREIGTNVNKPVSFDIGIDAMAMGGISWSFYGKKTSYRLRYLIRTNIVGYDFMPDYWESYYEVTEGVSGTSRCSGHWNHNVVRHELTLDLQFPHSTWRVGAEHEYLRYGTKNTEYIRQQINIVIGCLWHYKIRANKKF